MWTDFKPAIRFVVIFVATYFVGNILYGLYIRSQGNSPDIFTRLVADQSSLFLNVMKFDVVERAHETLPSVHLLHQGNVVITIFEGCNGINLMIVFVAFVFSFGGSKIKMLWFIPCGILLIHFVNLLRILLLYWVAIDFQHYFYYVHKYFFTAILYLFVFLLWVVWVKLREREPQQRA